MESHEGFFPKWGKYRNTPKTKFMSKQNEDQHQRWDFEDGTHVLANPHHMPS
jgi:hypothetical protein